jgi:hypothetical protein
MVVIGHDPEEGPVYGPGQSGIISEHLHAAQVPTRRLAGGRWVAVIDGHAVPVLCPEIIPIMTEDGPATGRCGEFVDAEGGLCEPCHQAVNSWLALSEAEKAAWERRHDMEGF